MPDGLRLIHEDAVSRVRFESAGGVQLLSNAVREQLGDVLSELESRAACRVVVFEAEGRTFIAGADVNELQLLNPESAAECSRETHALFERIEQLPAATVAAIHAACAGGGFELALACDLRFAAEGAKIGLPEVSLGLIPGWGGTVRMTRLFGPSVAKYVVLRGELLPAAEARRLGLVHDVAPDADFSAFVQSQVDLLLQRSPAAVRTAKQLLRKLPTMDRTIQFAAEAEAFGECFASPESHEGIAAFLEKRKRKQRGT